MIHFTVVLTMLIMLIAAPAGAQQSGVGKAVGDVLSDVLGKDEQRIHAQVVATTRSSLIVKADDGQTYTVDTSSLPAAGWSNLQPGRGVTLTVKRGKTADTLVASRIAADAPGSYPSASPGTTDRTAATQSGYQRLHGYVESLGLSGMTLKADNGQTVSVDTSGVNKETLASIQPGVYRLRLKSSSKAAMAAILDPANQLVSKVTIPEGYTAKQVLADLAKKTGLQLADLTAAASRIENLGLPDGITAKSPEGFLFPSTYDFDPAMSADAVVQTLTQQFGAEYAHIGLAAGAKALNITPYQALTIASMIESEAKFPQDRPKIARVILNRLAKKMPLGIDAVNRYGVALEGKDPNSVTYREDSPYNVRIHTGLPPTPISNPGEASLQAAINPAPGNWLYYVVDDAAGHHLFTADEPTWAAAVATCKAHGWGC